MKVKFSIKEIPSKWKVLWERWKQFPKNKKIIAGVGSTTLVIVIATGAILLSGGEKIVYVETTAEVGNLTVGITEDGNVEVEETEQIFDVDINEFSSENESSFAWESGGGMGNMMPGMGSMGVSFSNSTSDTRELVVEEMYVSVGQEITEGTPICRLTEESLTSIRNGLVDDEAVAKSTLEERETDLAVSELSALQTLEMNLMYGDTAQITYNASVNELSTKVKEAEEKLEEAQETLTENEETLAVKLTDLESASKVLENAEYIKDGTDMKSQLYLWIQEENNRYDSESTVDSLQEEIEKLQETIEQNKTEVENAKNSLSTAQKDYELGVIEAKALYDTQMLKYKSAQETYDTSIASSELNYEIAMDEYEEAKAKLDEFNAVVVDNNLVAVGEGVISAINIEKGDSIYQDSDILTYNNYEDVSITITLEEEDRKKIEIGSLANVSLAALEEDIFSGEVTEIGDAVYDNDSGTNTYEVTITLAGSLEKVFDGMSAEVTLITKEEKEVLYVMNRSIIRSGVKSFVKVKRESGKIEKVEVETGFSDGVYVEIISGLVEGDIVLVESKVSES